jgi:hypothetical protein
MMGRRLVGCLLLVGLAVPVLGASPHAHRGVKGDVAIAPPVGMGTRVFARSESGGDAASASPAPSPVAAPDGPGPAASPSPEIAARARSEFDANRAGKIDRAHYTAELNGVITDDLLASAAATLRSLGPVKTFVQIRRISSKGQTVYVFRIEFDGASPAIEEMVGWDTAGKVAFLSFGRAG